MTTAKKENPDSFLIEYTTRLIIQHLLLIEDHLLEYHREPSDQCLACVYWHLEKLIAYASLECVKFEGMDTVACNSISTWAASTQALLDTMSQKQALELAREVRELRYDSIEMSPVKSHLGECAISSCDAKLAAPGVEAIAGLLEKKKRSLSDILKQNNTCEQSLPKYRYLSTFFANTSAETILFSNGGERIERKIDKTLAKLESGIKNIHESQNFRDFMDTMAKFHNYSLGNIMLITLQKPDATRVAGFNTWKEMERWVKKGEQGIAILAPCFPPKSKKEEEDEEIKAKPIYFRSVSVFDVSQTEGKEIPRIEVPTIKGEKTAPLFKRAMSFANSTGIEVSLIPKPKESPDLMGYWQKANKLIWVRPDAPQEQRTKTLLHEIAHATAELRGAREAEVMAEGVAYTVAAHYGFDTGVRSFPYVALWAKDVKVLKQNLEIIRVTAKHIIEGIDKVSSLEESPLPDSIGVANTDWLAVMLDKKVGEGEMSESNSPPDITPDMPISYVQAKKRPDGKWQLFFTGTRNEVFPNELFISAVEAKMAFKVARAKASQDPELSAVIRAMNRPGEEVKIQ